MWDYARDHAIQLEDSRDLDEEGGKVGGGGGLARTCAHPGNFDLVCPADEEGVLVLPVEGTLEQIGAWAVCRTVDKRYAALGVRVVYLDTLEIHGILCEFHSTYVEVTGNRTRSFAHAMRFSRHRTCHTGPSPE